jgi:hypothetical protein
MPQSLRPGVLRQAPVNQEATDLRHTQMKLSRSGSASDMPGNYGTWLHGDGG